MSSILHGARLRRCTLFNHSPLYNLKLKNCIIKNYNIAIHPTSLLLYKKNYVYQDIVVAFKPHRSVVAVITYRISYLAWFPLHMNALLDVETESTHTRSFTIWR